jgi:hypothetical protein
MGGPCHQYGGGAPPKQINTRACGQSSQKNENENVAQSSQPISQAPSPKKTEEMSVAQLSKDDVPSNGQSEVMAIGGPCHLFWWVGGFPINK